MSTGTLFHCDREGCEATSDEMDDADDLPMDWHRHIVGGEVFDFHHADCVLVFLAGFPQEEPRPEPESDPESDDDEDLEDA